MESYTQKVRHPEEDRVAGSTDGIVSRSIEAGRYDQGIEIETGPVQLSPEHIQKIDQALEFAGYFPADLSSVDSEQLQEGFRNLSIAGDKEAEKSALKYIVELVRTAVG